MTRRKSKVKTPSIIPLSSETLATHWTLSTQDKIKIAEYRKNYRIFIAIQLCAVRLYGRFLLNPNELPIEVVNYLSQQLDLPPVMTVIFPERQATLAEHRQHILAYLGFNKYDAKIEKKFKDWIEYQARKGALPHDFIPLAERYFLDNRIILPGITVIERQITATCNVIHSETFEAIYKKLDPAIRQEISVLLTASENQQKSYFNLLKEYPPSATAKSILSYIDRYETLKKLNLDIFENNFIDPQFLSYLFKLTKHYHARDLKRFNECKRYALMICFLIESRKIILDHLVNMHDQYILEICRECKNSYEKKHREFRRKHKKAVDIMLISTDILLELPEKKTMTRADIFKQINEKELRASQEDLRIFKRLEERGYGDLLLARYPNLRKYFSSFIKLPFYAQKGSDDLIEAIEIVRKLDSGELIKLPDNVSLHFISHDLQRALKNKKGDINRNAWEMGLAITMRDKLRSGDLYLPESKQHVSFWNLTVSELYWDGIKKDVYNELQMPKKEEVKQFLTSKYDIQAKKSTKLFPGNTFASIVNGKLKLKRYDKLILPKAVQDLQKIISSRLPIIRIENLLMEVDKITGFSRHFKPIQGHEARPDNFYKTLISAIISQSTNLGIMAMSASVEGVTVDMLRHVLKTHIYEESLTAASAEIVKHHHLHPLSASQGAGDISSSDAQRFKIRADCLLASYYPRYYGYYEKAIGIYTHVSNQSSVYHTQIISCGLREAPYVLDGLLENNTILKIKSHTTDTHGYTEIIFALCFLLGFYFMPRIRDLKDQQLYRIDKTQLYGEIDALLSKTADMDIVEEQWEAMMRVIISLKKRTTPAHVIVQRLTSSSPSDRLTKAFINLGRIVKTEYILRYLTDEDLRRTVQSQLNKGEYRHRIPRWIFFTEQGEFTTGDYEEIMNKASCLSLVSNAILLWNTIKIDDILKELRAQGEVIDDEILSHISLLPYKHILPNGAYFVEKS